MFKGTKERVETETNSEESNCSMFKILICCSPPSTEDDESVYDTYAEVGEDSRIGDRGSHRGARPAHPHVHNIQGFTTLRLNVNLVQKNYFQVQVLPRGGRYLTIRMRVERGNHVESPSPEVGTKGKGTLCHKYDESVLSSR